MRLRSGALAAAAFITFLGASLVQAADPSKPVDLAAGEAIYKAACVACHGVEGTGGHGGGSTLIGKLDAGQIRLITTTGRNNRPTFKDVYDMNQIRDASEYITSVQPKAAGASK